MLVIRLARIGRNRRPAFRIVVQEKTKAPKSDALEIIGSYNPLAKKDQWQVNADRVKYYLSIGAKPSPTVHNTLINLGIISGKKQRVVRGKKAAPAETKPEAKAIPEAEPKKEAPAAAVPAAEKKPAEAKAEATPEVKTETK